MEISSGYQDGRKKLPWAEFASMAMGNWLCGATHAGTVPLTASLGWAVGRGVPVWALGASWCREAFHGADATSC